MQERNQKPVASAHDPDLVSAVEDFRDVVIEIRARSAKLIALPESSEQRAAEQAVIDDHVGAMTTRCERLGLSLDDLFRLINEDLASRRDNVHKPNGDLLRALVDENTRAYADEALQRRELTTVIKRVRRATAARVAADRACAGFVAGWAVRGR